MYCIKDESSRENLVAHFCILGVSIYESNLQRFRRDEDRQF
ncbi:hypothetical protein NIES2104_11330 [Leptolyngbya sp. NIES-2104]|nr:hypothetical protein NIES2104_11330 [Leptolyngbya sp. NIES-2104]